MSGLLSTQHIATPPHRFDHIAVADRGADQLSTHPA